MPLLKRYWYQPIPIALHVLLLLLVAGLGRSTVTAQTLHTIKDSTYTDRSGHELHYTYAGRLDTGAPMVIFIHGAPANGGVFTAYLKDSALQQAALLLAPDRPGYGHSERGHPLTSIAAQAARLTALLDQSHQQVIVVGHSLGTAIAARMVMDYPDRIAGLILISPIVDSGAEQLLGWNRLASHFGLVLRRIAPQVWSTVGEKLAHPNELRSMESLWNGIRIPVLVLRSEHDRLAPAQNADFLRQHVDPQHLAIRTFPGASHNLQRTQRDTVKQRILSLLTAAGT